MKREQISWNLDPSFVLKINILQKKFRTGGTGGARGATNIPNFWPLHVEANSSSLNEHTGPQTF